MPERSSPDAEPLLTDASRSLVNGLEERLRELERRTDVAAVKRRARGWAQQWRDEAMALRLEAARGGGETTTARMNARAKALEECADVVQDVA